MKLRKSPAALVAIFDEVMPGPPATRRKMFGYPACFVNGNLFMSLFEDSMILRLPAESREELIQVHGAKPFAPMAGHVMKEYVALPEPVLTRPQTAFFVDRQSACVWRAARAQKQKG